MKCPYGCGANNKGGHISCPKVEESFPVHPNAKQPKCRLLPLDKQIKTTHGLFGGLPESERPAFDTTGKARCKWCWCWYDDHSKCDWYDYAEGKGKGLPPEDVIRKGKVFRTPPKEAGEEVQAVVAVAGSGPVVQKWKPPRKKPYYWVEALTILTPTKVALEFDDNQELADFLMSLKYETVITMDNKWWVPIHILLKSHDAKIETDIFLEVKGKFQCRNMGKFSDEDDPEAYQIASDLVWEVMGIDLNSKVSLAQAGYDWWWQQQEGVEILTPDHQDYVMQAFYGARQDGEFLQWNSSLNPVDCKYADVLADPESDVRVQLDSNSMYGAVMKSGGQVDSYYIGRAHV